VVVGSIGNRSRRATIAILLFALIGAGIQDCGGGSAVTQTTSPVASYNTKLSADQAIAIAKDEAAHIIRGSQVEEALARPSSFGGGVLWQIDFLGFFYEPQPPPASLGSRGVIQPTCSNLHVEIDDETGQATTIGLSPSDACQ